MAKEILGNNAKDKFKESELPSDDDLIKQIKDEYDSALQYRSARVANWHANEALLYGKKPPTLSHRSNILVQLMAGFEDTLLAKINAPIITTFSPQEEGDVVKAKKATSFFEFEKSPQREDWEQKDLLTKKLAMVSGRAIFKIYSSHPYKHKLEPIDHYDFLIDPLASGLSIESARYLGQDNILKSRAELKANSSYIKSEVKKLLNAYSEEHHDLPDNEEQEKQHRLDVAGFDLQNTANSGPSTIRLLEWYTHIDGVRYYFLLDPKQQIIIKKLKLSELTASLDNEGVPFYPFDSWAYYPDLFNFWSPSPMDRVRELILLRNVALNQLFDNFETINKPMKIYDPNTFKNPALLKYTPDGLVPVSAGRDPKTGIHVLEGQSFGTGTARELNMILEEITGKITGATTGAAGLESQTEKVGIYYGNMREVEKRMLQFESSYSRCFMRLAQKYLSFLSERLDGKQSVKILGAEGIETHDLTSEDLVKFDVLISGGVSAAEKDAVTKKMHLDYLATLVNNPAVNQSVLAELSGRVAEISETDLKRLLSLERKDEKQIVRAAEDLQKLVEGEDVAPYAKADNSYLQEIIDFLLEHDLDQEVETRIGQYFASILEIASRNTLLKAHLQAADAGMLGQAMAPQQLPIQSPGVDPGAPLPDSMGGANMQHAGTVPSMMQETYGQVQ